MKLRALLILSILTYLTLLSGVTAVPAHAAYSLSLNTKDGQGNSKTSFLPGDDLYLHVTANDLQGLAGCVFTLNYNSSMLVAPATDANGLPTDPTAIISQFPFTFVKTDHPDSGTITSRENSSLTDKILFAGASIDTTTGGSKFTSATPGTIFPLFVIKFKVLTTAKAGSYTFFISQTKLDNTAAGYAASGENIPLLYGAVPNTDSANWNNLSSSAFPVLLDSLPTQVATDINVVPLGTCLNLLVRRTSGSHNTIQDAYNNAADGDTIKSQAATFSENLDFSRNISVTIKGGYDCAFSTNTQKSQISGSVTIRNGTIVVENLIIR